MKVVIKYRSDFENQYMEESVELEHVPVPRVGDSVMAQGRPRQVSRRMFHILGKDASGVWRDVGDEPVVEVFLVG